MREHVSFEGAGGVTLRGWYERPDDPAGPVPGIVMAHGFSATKEMGLPAYAEYFRDAGYAVLVYDHRCLGESDGEPRQLVNIWAQARDYRFALSWLAERPEVDADRLAVWGSSFSGGQVLVVGAVDRRVKAVIANVPFAALGGVDYSGVDIPDRMAAIAAALDAEPGVGPADAHPEPITMAVVAEGDSRTTVAEGDSRPVFLGQEESTRWFLTEGRMPGSRWQNHVELVNLGAIDPLFDPGVALASLSPTPVLLVVATEDRLAATADTLAAFEAAKEPKRLEMVVGDHFVDYAGPAFDQAAAAMVRFLDDVL